MSAEHNFWCSICMEMFTDPVTTPCGHNFCKSCISTYWENIDTITCPLCKQVFSTIPQLAINTMMREWVSQLRLEGEAPCDVCTGTKVYALKSCLECVIAYCESHLESQMKVLKQFAVDVSLDPLTAHPKLVLSNDLKQVKHSDVKQNLPNNRERFSNTVCVLGKQRFSSGTFYFEVQVKGKTEWDLGVAQESINRKGDITATPENRIWIVGLQDGTLYKAYEDPSITLHLKSVPETVGVFVFYEGGVVSFYDVDATALIYSFTHCCFTHKLRPIFSPRLNHSSKNSAPLIICPVNQSE